MAKQGIKVWTVRIALLLLGLVVLAALALWLFLRGSLARLDGSLPTPGLAADVTVERDAHGVPMISGRDRNDIAYATGYLHAQERFFQMDLMRRSGAGELAELFGPKAVPLDRAHRLHRFRARAEAALRDMDVEQRRLIERYVAGVNAGLHDLSARPFEYALAGAAPRDWNAADSLLVVYAMYLDLQDNLAARELARGWLREHSTPEQLAILLPEASSWDAPLDADAVHVPALAIPARAPDWWGRPAVASSTRIASRDIVDAVGSNNWAVAGSRSASGAAIVSNDMHLGLRLPNIWYRIATRYPGADGSPRRTVGVTLPGAPPVAVAGSNGHVAWGYTNSYGDFLDLIRVESDPAKAGQVRTPAGWETPVEQRETILVKGAPAERMVVRETRYGPLFEAGGTAYALHWVAHLPGAVNFNLRHIESANTVEEALKAANTLGIPGQNFMVGDDQGNIGWTIAGLLPRRAQPGFASSYPVAADGDTFTEVLDPAAYPRVINPAGGQLSTANSRQLDGAGQFLIGDGGFDIGARNRQIRDALGALGPRATPRDVYAVTLDDRALFIAPWRERAMAALDRAALQGQPRRAEFLRLLQHSWTGRASVDAVGYRLSRNFMWALHDLLYGGLDAQLARLDERASIATATSRWPEVIAHLIDEQNPDWLPPGYANWQAVQLAAVDRVIEELGKDGVKLADARWGQRNRADVTHPIVNAAPFLRHWLAAPRDELPGDANMPRVAGPRFGQSERMTLSPGKEEQGVFSMPGGQSGHPLSPYFQDSQRAWVDGTPAPLLPGPAAHTLRFVKR